MTKMQEALDALDAVHALDAIKRSISAAYASGYAAGSKTRQWVGLTDEEFWGITDKVIGLNSCCGWEEKYAKAIEAKLKAKNHDTPT